MRYPVVTAILLGASAAAAAHPDVNAVVHADPDPIEALMHLLGQHYAPLLIGALIVALIGWLHSSDRGRSDRFRR